jgi:uncharacterized cupin superfamily protein
MMSELKIVHSAATTDALPDMPLAPESVLEGSPQATGIVLTQSADKRVSSGLWACTAGQFEWTFAWDEFVYVLEGGASIRTESGQTIELRSGDSAHFPLGLKTVWTVTDHIRKVFTVRTPEPLEL